MSSAQQVRNLPENDGTRISDLRKLPGMDWVTALKAPAIKKLAEGPLQMSLFDTCNLAEITHPITPASG